MVRQGSFLHVQWDWITQRLEEDMSKRKRQGDKKISATRSLWKVFSNEIYVLESQTASNRVRIIVYVCTKKLLVFLEVSSLNTCRPMQQPYCSQPSRRKEREENEGGTAAAC